MSHMMHINQEQIMPHWYNFFPWPGSNTKRQGRSSRFSSLYFIKTLALSRKLFFSANGRLNSYKIGAKPAGEVYFESNYQWSKVKLAVTPEVCSNQHSQEYITSDNIKY